MVRAQGSALARTNSLRAVSSMALPLPVDLLAVMCRWAAKDICKGDLIEYHEKIVGNKGSGKNMTALADAIVHKDAAKLLGLVGVDNLRALYKELLLEPKKKPEMVAELQGVLQPKLTGKRKADAEQALPMKEDLLAVMRRWAATDIYKDDLIEYHEKIIGNKGSGKNMTALADAIVRKDAAKLLGLVGVDNLKALYEELLLEPKKKPEMVFQLQGVLRS